jgi:hypothetical protein
MRKLRLLLLVLAMPIVFVRVAADVSGEWKVDGTFDDASLARGWPQPRATLVCALKLDNGKVTGECKPSGAQRGASVVGEAMGENIRWRFEIAIQPGAAPVAMTYTGRLNQAQTAVRGTFAVSDFGGDFTATKQ